MKFGIPRLPAGLGVVLIALSGITAVLVFFGSAFGVLEKRTPEKVTDSPPVKLPLEEEIESEAEVLKENDIKPPEEIEPPEKPKVAVAPPEYIPAPRNENILLVQLRPDLSVCIRPLSFERAFDVNKNSQTSLWLKRSLPRLIAETIDSHIKATKKKRSQIRRSVVDLNDETAFVRLGEGFEAVLMTYPYLLSIEQQTGANRGYGTQATLEVLRTSLTIEFEDTESGTFSSLDISAKATLQPGASRIRQEKLLFDDIKEQLSSSDELAELLRNPKHVQIRSSTL